MKFEELPNELLFNIFEFLNIIDLFRAFHGLNYRLDKLLFSNKQKYHLDSRSISKHDLKIMCQDYLSVIINQINSLRLSDDDETLVSSELLFSRGFILDQFNHLQLLSLYHIHSLNRIYQILLQCHHLTQLSLTKCKFWHNEKDFQCIINNIWSLPKLIYCKLDYNLPGDRLLIQISNISLSIQYLSIKNIHCNFNTLSHLFKYTPNLQRLCTTSFCGSRDEQLETSVSSIISLNIVQKSSSNTMINLFHNMINLSCLTLDTNYIYLNGYTWENIFIEHLPNIKIFRLRMYFELSLNSSREEQINILIDSFQTPFWLEKHQWFVQCDWSLFKSHQHAVLYTLPYIFNDFLYDNLCQSKSTLLNNRSHRLYDRVNSLQYLEYTNKSINNLSHCSIQFSNVRHLCITLPFHYYFQSIVPALNQLISLDIVVNNNLAYHYLQALLNRAPQLYSLTFRCLQNITMALFKLTNKSIRRLDFISMSELPIGHFNSFECDLLSKSSLGQQCNVLLIKVQNRTNILHLIKTMSNLRSLIVQCEDETTRNNELLQWLQDQLPSTYSMNRDLDEPSKIRLVID